MKTWLYAAMASLLLLAGCGGGLVQDNPRQGPYLSHKASINPEELWEQQSNIDVPIQVNKQVKDYLVYFSTKRKEVIQRQLARSTRYLPMIKEVFQEYGLPEDLAYLAMIESGFNPEAQSPAGARGMWQFIKGTGVRYGLVIDGCLDERRDPVKSTRAAARYLRDLYRQFGSWYLAAASYNCGERRVEKELHKGNGENFWELSAGSCLPSETKNYVPQMIAATIIAKNPERYGFTDIPYQQPDTNLAAAAPAGEAPAGGRGNQGSAPGPVQPPALKAAPDSPGRSRPYYAAAPVPRQPAPSPDNQAGPAKKPTLPAPQAQNGYARSPKAAADGDSTPYTASIFGSIGSPKKELARENRSNLQTSAQKKRTNDRKVGERKSSKPNHASLALKREPKNGKAKIVKRKNSPAGGNSARIARTKPKPLVVSEAR
ncbi:MAG: transglycosylase SLT domain-containing protein [Desulfobaccales bacterium]